MALTNLNNNHLTAAQVTAAQDAITSLETALATINVNLTAEDRQRYGSINEQNKLFVNKAKSYMEQYPQFVPLFLDKAEYDRDYAARQQLESRMQRLSSVTEQLSDTKILLDFDNYHNSITFYRNMKYLSGENVPGTNVIYDDMKQFFVTTSTTPTPPTENQSEGS